MMPEFRMINVGEVTLRCAIEGSGPLAIMVHGFPESWYSWRHQIGPVAAAGFTACAIDVRGYGGSDKPHEVSAYGLKQIAQDLVGLRDALAPGEQVVLIGHDWGAPIVWNAAFTHPDVFRAVAGLSVPFAGAPLRPFTDVFREHFTSQGRFFYQEYFQEPGVAEAEAEADPRGWVRKMMYSISGDVPPGDYWNKPAGSTFLQGLPDVADPAGLPAWLSAADLDYYEAEFKQSGFRGPLNRYRNHEADYEWLKAWQGKQIEQPCLFIGGSRDPATTLFGAVEDPVAMMRMFAPRVEGHVLEGCGHWTQQERPDAVNALLVDWLSRL
ncbi:alpha/beta fold hydrolase [Novosphingobium sp. B 225]|uniref:alpha/beta fold hydrolase n=1 Tax=Novosphingobium sp. B 225 TaxID=1961849 RepID=UPI0020CEC311|nr:alpha/beta hydrolase [Novosphingobium sp. B 225]